MGFSISNEDDDVREDFDMDEVIGDSEEEVPAEEVVDEVAEGDEPAEDQTEGEESAEDENLYEFEVPNENGVDKVTLSDKELKQLLELREANSVDVDEINDLKKMRPVVDGLLRSDGAKRFLDYHSKGYDDTRIIEGMFLEKFPWAKDALEQYLANQQQAAQEEPAEFDTVGDEIQYHVQNALRQAGLLDVVQQQRQAQQQQQVTMQQQQLAQYNDNVLGSVFSNVGVNPAELTQQDWAEMRNGFARAYPLLDVSKHALTPEQVETVYWATLGRKASKPQQQKHSGFTVRNAKAPTVLPGTGGGRGSAQDISASRNRKELSKNERSKLIDDFFN